MNSASVLGGTLGGTFSKILSYREIAHTSTTHHQETFEVYLVAFVVQQNAWRGFFKNWTPAICFPSLHSRKERTDILDCIVVQFCPSATRYKRNINVPQC
jgi:hypothetical protein